MTAAQLPCWGRPRSQLACGGARLSAVSVPSALSVSRSLVSASLGWGVCCLRESVHNAGRRCVEPLSFLVCLRAMYCTLAARMCRSRSTCVQTPAVQRAIEIDAILSAFLGAFGSVSQFCIHSFTCLPSECSRGEGQIQASRASAACSGTARA